MPLNKRTMPAARGPLARIAVSRASNLSYTEFAVDDEKCILEIEGREALERFAHPDFDTKHFRIYEGEPHGKDRAVFRSWKAFVHVVRDGVVVKKIFSLRCDLALALVRQRNQIDRAANEPSGGKKSLRARADIL